MFANIIDMAHFFGVNYHDIIVNVVIMVSAIIVCIGFLKPILFDRIKNKELRKGALALTNIGACFVAALGYFLRNGWNLKYYPLAAVALTVVSIVTYYVYETVPGARKLIGGIGLAAISKVFNVGILAATNDDAKVVGTEAKNAVTELKTFTRNELKKASTKINVDKDLRNL